MVWRIVFVKKKKKSLSKDTGRVGTGGVRREVSKVWIQPVVLKETIILVLQSQLHESILFPLSPPMLLISPPDYIIVHSEWQIIPNKASLQLIDAFTAISSTFH